MKHGLHKKIVNKPVLAIGPFHPLQEEMEFFQLTVDGEIVTDIDVRLSYNHRGIEKISESLQFDQISFLVSRMKWTNCKNWLWAMSCH